MFYWLLLLVVFACLEAVRYWRTCVSMRENLLQYVHLYDGYMEAMTQYVDLGWDGIGPLVIRSPPLPGSSSQTDGEQGRLRNYLVSFFRRAQNVQQLSEDDMRRIDELTVKLHKVSEQKRGSGDGALTSLVDNFSTPVRRIFVCAHFTSRDG